MNEINQIWSQFLKEIGESSSATFKKEVLERYKDNDILKKILHYTLNPYLKYNVTEKAIINTAYDPTKINPYIMYEDIFELLDACNNRQITGHEAIHTIIFYMMQWDCRDLLLRIIKRDLKLRIGDKLINDVIPGLIPVFNVQLGETFDGTHVDFVNEKWVASHKLDGLRCLGIIDHDGNVVCKTRGGHPFNTLKIIEDELKASGLRGVVFDGELCIIDENGREDFQAIMKVYNDKDEKTKQYIQIPNPKYLVFDLINYDDFIAEQGSCIYQHRYDYLKLEVNHPHSKLKHFEIVEQIPITSAEHLTEMMVHAEKMGWEGLYIKRADVGYEGKRSWYQQKVKIFQDIEVKIVRYEIGPFRCVIDSKQQEIQTLLKVFVDYKGNVEVGVGSGFTLEERNRYAENPKWLIDKEMTVKHGGETKPEKGKLPSLRWPVKKFIWENGRHI